MIRFAYIALVFLLISSCVEFKQLSLYDGMEPAPVQTKPETINKVVEPVIYTNNTNDMWGLEETVCKKAELTYDDTYEGEQAVKISWDRNAEGCEFAGIGIGWDGYAGKDLTGIMDYAAITFYVKAQKERMFGLPIVLTLEDYSGGMGFAYTANKYFERTFIDTNWQKVEVPLSAFDLETENLDPSNIKQLQLELQQSGNIVIDNIRLEFYTPQEVEPWMEEEPRPDPLATPITIFDEKFINGNGFGLYERESQIVRISTDESFSGEKSIYAKWNRTEESEDVFYFGASWNKWYPIDFEGSQDNYALSFQILKKGEVSDDLELYVGLRDYSGVRGLTRVSAEYAAGGKTVLDQGWTKITVPLSRLGDALDYSKIKHLVFDMRESGEVYIDDIRFIRRKVD